MTTVALVLYPKFTALDIVGPFQTLVDVPGLDVFFVAAEAGPVLDHTGRLGLVATRTFHEVDAVDMVVVPGGFADSDIADDDPVVAFLRKVHPGTTWTTSVCTGSIFLAKAGVLEGSDATTHWAARSRLQELGANPVPDRVVRRGKIITAAGVSSGIDMGLALVAAVRDEVTARAVQLAIEYDPQPPFDSGSPEKATPEVLAAVAGLFGSN